MTDLEFEDALDGLFAYDTGCTDSGIHNEVLREQVKQELADDLKQHPFSLVGPRLTKFAKRYLEPPYGLEDMAHFIRWLRDHMEIDL